MRPFPDDRPQACVLLMFLLFPTSTFSKMNKIVQPKTTALIISGILAVIAKQAILAVLQRHLGKTANIGNHAVVLTDMVKHLQ